jgi:hypothetical protein
MKQKYFFMTTLVLLVIILVSSYTYKEGFLDAYCDQYADCISCAGASGCSWCPKSKLCLKSYSLKSTDKDCNQANTISSNFLCSSEISERIAPTLVKENDLDVYQLYKDQIANKIPPPNVYSNPDMEYSPETVMANVSHLRKEVETEKDNIRTLIRNITSPSIEQFEDVYDNTYKVLKPHLLRKKSTTHPSLFIADPYGAPTTYSISARQQNTVNTLGPIGS